MIIWWFRKEFQNIVSVISFQYFSLMNLEHNIFQWLKLSCFLCQFLCKWFPCAWLGKTREEVSIPQLPHNWKSLYFTCACLAGDLKELLELCGSKQDAFRVYGCNIICFCENLLAAVESESRTASNYSEMFL